MWIKITRIKNTSNMCSYRDLIALKRLEIGPKKGHLATLQLYLVRHTAMVVLLAVHDSGGILPTRRRGLVGLTWLGRLNIYLLTLSQLSKVYLFEGQIVT